LKGIKGVEKSDFNAILSTYYSKGENRDTE
jgi:hypothetical protein